MLKKILAPFFSCSCWTVRTRVAVYVVTFLMWGWTPKLSMSGLQPIHVLWLNGVAVSRAVSLDTTMFGLQVCFEDGLFILYLVSECLCNIPPIYAVPETLLKVTLTFPTQTSSSSPYQEPSIQGSSLPLMRDARHKGVRNGSVKGSWGHLINDLEYQAAKITDRPVGTGQPWGGKWPETRALVQSTDNYWHVLSKIQCGRHMTPSPQIVMHSLLPCNNLKFLSQRRKEIKLSLKLHSIWN